MKMYSQDLDEDIVQPYNMTTHLSIAFSFSISVIVLLVIKIVSTKYDKNRIINELTMLPFYTLIAYIFGIIIQLMIVTYADENALKGDSM